MWAFKTKSIGLVWPVIKGEISRERERFPEREISRDIERERERERIVTAILVSQISC